MSIDKIKVIDPKLLCKEEIEDELEDLETKYTQDKLKFLKERKSYSSRYHLDFDDYVTKHGSKKVKKYWNKKLWGNAWK